MAAMEPKHPPNESRHIILSTMDGMVTEMERVQGPVGSPDKYIVRLHKATETDEMILHVGEPSDQTPWTGFRYKNAHWSFVRQLAGCESD
jgi:hypothetical protein